MLVNPCNMPNLIKELRVRAGLSQESLAEQVGTTFQQISRLERGQRDLSLEWMERLAPPLKVRPAGLIDREVAGLVDPERRGEFIDNPRELTVLRLWRRVGVDMQIAMMQTARAHLRAAGLDVDARSDEAENAATHRELNPP
jgi:transcriptional regulator with XRE-family HTH domain